ncbi:restriction endonuclease subunit S [Vandammella animalimorsus]|uniref:Restriction endonuclease n=1 Tax=Vandammella animalimorsus TaxID=2029117 RepID=A0A2A2A7T6_9BURK|nr:restriction endonuclease subunit S [Vandammella animalimorsus]PAT33827.1 restriction endonuclease [Vandammella animalimorsus]
MTVTTPFTTQRLKYVATINDEALSESADPEYEIAYIDIGNVDSQGQIHDIVNYRYEDAPSRARRIVRDGDVIISTVRTYLQAIAPIENPPENLIVSTGFAVVRPSNLLDPKFCKYALRESQFLWEVETRSTGVSYPAINASDLGEIKISLPDIHSQRRIANYLDRETARIDRLIAEKERMLALLEEKRSALISRLVTRGLNPDTPLKPSGQEWLGDIPAHWEIWRLKYIGRVESGSGFPPDYQGNENFELLFLKVSDMNLPGNEYWISTSNNTVSREMAHQLSATALPSGAVVYAKIGAALLLNKRRILQREACIDNNMSAFIPSLVTSEWAHAWLSILDFGEFVNPGAIPSFTEGQQKELPMAVPPIEEQTAITRYIEGAIEQTGTLVAEISLSIGLLRERRSALITAAVTGKIPLKEMDA